MQLTTRAACRFRGRIGRIGRNVHGAVTSEHGTELAPVCRTMVVAVPLSTCRTVYEMIAQVNVAPGIIGITIVTSFSIDLYIYIYIYIYI